MVAPRKFKKVFCTVLRVPVADVSTIDTVNRFNCRPSELLPWADPYIARLVRNLQNEVRNQRESTRMDRVRDARLLSAELEPPLPLGAEPDLDWKEESRRTLRD